MNELTPDTVIDPQVGVIEQAIEKHSKQCKRCLRDIETQVVTDYSSEGDGASCEAEAGHAPECGLLDERID